MRSSLTLGTRQTRLFTGRRCIFWKLGVRAPGSAARPVAGASPCWLQIVNDSYAGVALVLDTELSRFVARNGHGSRRKRSSGDSAIPNGETRCIRTYPGPKGCGDGRIRAWFRKLSSHCESATRALFGKWNDSGKANGRGTNSLVAVSVELFEPVSP